MATLYHLRDGEANVSPQNVKVENHDKREKCMDEKLTISSNELVGSIPQNLSCKVGPSRLSFEKPVKDAFSKKETTYLKIGNARKKAKHPQRRSLLRHWTLGLCFLEVKEKSESGNKETTKLGKGRSPIFTVSRQCYGIEMFGFSSPAIIQGIETMDLNRVCTEYWKSRMLLNDVNHLEKYKKRISSSPAQGVSNLWILYFLKAYNGLVALRILGSVKFMV
ncbi:hypothetical protein GIB67_024354 [Kingdonia uniflora]|uniref:Uncharacterized protein n=1 Tax=Kingdonia uniflora TaxID=39325 RepID=A0A7J7LFF2_9MAGN|nr:hypothetical protein GIB67_024354 [Kingdonia uniflora]